MVCDWGTRIRKTAAGLSRLDFISFYKSKRCGNLSLFFSQLPMRFPGGIASFSRESMRDGRAAQSQSAAAASG
jgi:hypothetical protein